MVLKTAYTLAVALTGGDIPPRQTSAEREAGPGRGLTGALLSSGGRLGPLSAVILKDPAHKLSGGTPDDPLLLHRPGMKGGAPLATLVHQHIRPMTGKFLASGVGLPAAIGIAEFAFLLAAFHCYLMAFHAAFNKAPEQRLSPLLSSNLLASGWKNNGGLGVALRHLRRITRIECAVPL